MCDWLIGIVICVCVVCVCVLCVLCVVFLQAEDGIRDLVRSRGLGDVYKRQLRSFVNIYVNDEDIRYLSKTGTPVKDSDTVSIVPSCLLYTSDAADERSSVDLGGRRIIKNNNNVHIVLCRVQLQQDVTNQRTSVKTIARDQTNV